jgi:hypothetical protein
MEKDHRGGIEELKRTREQFKKNCSLILKVKMGK